MGLGLFGLGTLAVVGTVVLSNWVNADVLLALGGSGLFVGVIVYYLTPEQFVSGDVSEAVYAAYANAGAAMVGGRVRGDLQYIPQTSDSDYNVRLFVSGDNDRHDETTSGFEVVTVDGRRGVTFRPTGEELFPEFEQALSGSLADRPGPLTEQLTNSVVNQFELAEDVDATVDIETGETIVGVRNGRFGRVDGFDHPIPSLVAVGLARGLNRPVKVDTGPAGDDEQIDYLVTCRWDAEREVSRS